MKTNYSETNDNKFFRILRRHGFVYLVRRIINRMFIQYLILLFAKKEFSFLNRMIPYFRHGYNTTFVNERAVEIPIFLELMKTIDSSDILEIGNVLGHYFPAEWTVVDKYEVAPGVMNIDVMDYLPTKKYKLIVAISTFEHIGYDEEPKDSSKVIRAIEHIKNECLTDNGEIWFSIPVGWNTSLDQLLFSGAIETNKSYFFKRRNWKNEWVQCRADELAGLPYQMVPSGLVIAQLKR